MVFLPIPAGSFMMGADVNFDADLREDECPKHLISISKPFYLGKFEVTSGAVGGGDGEQSERFQRADAACG